MLIGYILIDYDIISGKSPRSSSQPIIVRGLERPLRFLGEPCVGVVSQIVDLDNSSKKVPEVTDLRDEVTSRYHPVYRNTTVTLRL